MSLESFPGVIEVMDGPKKVRDDVMWLGEPLGSFTIFFHNWTSGSSLKIMAHGRQFLGSRTPQIDFFLIQKVPIPIYFIHGRRWCVPKNPNFTHLENEHFFGDTVYIHIEDNIYSVFFIFDVT